MSNERKRKQKGCYSTWQAGIVEHAQAALKHASFESGMAKQLVKSTGIAKSPLPSLLHPAHQTQTEELIQTRQHGVRHVSLHTSRYVDISFN